MSAERARSVAVAITGASGALYAVRTLAALLAQSVHVELVISDYGKRLLRDELGETATLENLRPWLIAKYGQPSRLEPSTCRAIATSGRRLPAVVTGAREW